MDFNPKQWRFDESATEEYLQESSASYPNLPNYAGNNHHHRHHHLQQQNSVATALSLFSPYISDDKVPEMAVSGCCFSMGQWQELEVQAMVYRHMIAGAAVPLELLQLVSSSSSSHHHHQYYPHYQAANVVQSGYWGKAAMDPEPGRCRRTDGKKWRCSRDVVAGQKYCERHMNRGKNRSRKPVETNPTPTAAAAAVSQRMDFGGGGGGSTRFTLSGHSPSTNLLHLNQRPKSPFETTTLNNDQNPGGHRVLRRFFNDWPGSDNAGSVTDFSLKLGTGGNNGEETNVHAMNAHRDISRHHQLSWDHNNSWDDNSNGYNQVAHMGGGPLAEALR